MMVYRCCWRWWEIVAFGEDTRVVRVNGRCSGGTGAVIGTVAAGGVGDRVFVAWRGLSMLVSMLVVG
jgi:hypothetical protein